MRQGRGSSVAGLEGALRSGDRSAAERARGRRCCAGPQSLPERLPLVSQPSLCAACRGLEALARVQAEQAGGGPLATHSPGQPCSHTRHYNRTQEARLQPSRQTARGGACARACVCAGVCACLRARVGGARVCESASVNTHPNTRARVRIRTHTHTHAHTRTRTRTHTPARTHEHKLKRTHTHGINTNANSNTRARALAFTR